MSNCKDCGAMSQSELCDLCDTFRKVIFDNKDTTKVLLQLQAVLLIQKRGLDKCCKCGWDKYIEVDYKVDPTTMIGEKLSTINNENNLIALCPNCHWEVNNCPIPTI